MELRGGGVCAGVGKKKKGKTSDGRGSSKESRVFGSLEKRSRRVKAKILVGKLES